MNGYAFILTGLIASLILLICSIALLSRLKKTSKSKIFFIGHTATVNKSLNPTGAIIVCGELWPARSSTGNFIERGTQVKVLRVTGIFLEVEQS
jgi:membrane-bound ClpP family serine protease